MTNKLYDKNKKIIKRYLLLIILGIILYFILTYKLPYYVEGPGGLINTIDRFKTEQKIKQNGSINMTYVSEYPGTIPILIYAFINPNYDIKNISTKTIGNETEKDENNRSKLLNQESNDISLMLAYKYANISYKVTNIKLYVTYIDDLAQTNLKIKDQILKVNNQSIKDKQHIYQIISSQTIGDKINIQIKRNNKEYSKKAKLIGVAGEPKIGISIVQTMDIVSNKKVTFTFKKGESGSSCGLAMTLGLYNNVTKKDITHGKKIAITGTVDEDGYVGPIDGIKYKLKGAVKKKAEIFIVPVDNYKETIKYQKKYHYNIKIKQVSTVLETIKYLNNLK